MLEERFSMHNSILPSSIFLTQYQQLIINESSINSNHIFESTMILFDERIYVFYTLWIFQDISYDSIYEGTNVLGIHIIYFKVKFATILDIYVVM